MDKDFKLVNGGVLCITKNFDTKYMTRNFSIYLGYETLYTELGCRFSEDTIKKIANSICSKSSIALLSKISNKKVGQIIGVTGYNTLRACERLHKLGLVDFKNSSGYTSGMQSVTGKGGYDYSGSITIK